MFRFGTKAETLERLAPRLKHVLLCDQIIITIAEWLKSKDGVTERILAHFPNQPLAIRSSTTLEDGAETSNAGRFESVTNVASQAGAILLPAIRSAQGHVTNGARHSLRGQLQIAPSVFESAV